MGETVGIDGTNRLEYAVLFWITLKYAVIGWNNQIRLK